MIRHVDFGFRPLQEGMTFDKPRLLYLIGWSGQNDPLPYDSGVDGISCARLAGEEKNRNPDFEK